jgi:hypothetical protein
MYSVKIIDNIGCCPVCEHPTQCHGASVDYRALYWVLTGDTGISSKAISKHMLNIAIEGMFGFMPPSDSSDRRRCIKLLELIPEWIDRLPEMVRYDDKPDTGIVINSSGISAYSNSWAKQIPLIIKEGNL